MLLKIFKKGIGILQNSRISIKLTLVYAFMFSLVLLVLNASILYGVKFYMYNQAQQQIESVQGILANKLSPLRNNVSLSDNRILSDIPTNENISIQITDSSGNTINQSERFDLRGIDLDNHIKKEQHEERHIEEKEEHLLYKNISVDGGKYGTVNIHIVKDMHSEYGFLKILFGVMAAADFIGIAVSILIGYIIGKKMLKPIENITQTAENISIGNLKERIEVKGPKDELNRLAGTFNNMIDRLQESFNKQAQFVSDASHELRTPVAVIQGYANLLDRWGKDDREALEKSIYGIKFEADNMADLIEKLLFLARGDSGRAVVLKTDFMLNELICEVVSETQLIAAEKHNIESYKNEKVRINADYMMIKQLLRIFIENSIKFTPEGGTIAIDTEVSGDKVRIIVTDTGIGIPEDEIEHIFDRFYIVDKSRSKENGGTGLGLSIAKWIVDMHGGTINIESKEGKGTSVTVALKYI